MPTVRDRTSNHAYLAEIGQYPLLGAAQECALGQRIDAGRTAELDLPAARGRARARLQAVIADGERARDEFVRANLRLVVSIARRYGRHGGSLADAIQDGNLGLLRAVEKYDWRQGNKFSTYATWWIRQSIIRGTDQTARTVRLPSHVLDEIAALARARRDLAADGSCVPTSEDLAVAIGSTPRRVEELMILERESRSLAETIGDSNLTLGDSVAAAGIGVEAVALDLAEAEELAGLVDQLDERAAHVVRQRFGLGDERVQTLAEIGVELGVTKERVRQIEDQALRRLRRLAGRGPGRLKRTA